MQVYEVGRVGEHLFIAQIYFERMDGELPRIAAVPVAGGDVTWVAPAPSGAPASSPVDDRLAYLTRVDDIPTVRIVDTKTHALRELTLPPSPWELVEWSPDGTKLLVVRSDAQFIELDVATGETLRTLASGAEVFAGVTYVGDEIIVGRGRWLGDLWTTDLVPAR